MDLLPVEAAAVATPGVLRVLSGNVSRQDAIAQFEFTFIRRWMRPFTRSLQSVAEVYIPFQLFRATVSHRGAKDERLMAIDLLSGSLDPFSFQAAPRADQMLLINSRNCPQPKISLNEAQKKLETKLQRLFFQSGFFRVGNLNITITPLEMFFIPYWVGFFGSGTNASMEVIDAVRRVREGAKVRATVLDWLTQDDLA